MMNVFGIYNKVWLEEKELYRHHLHFTFSYSHFGCVEEDFSIEFDDRI